MANTFGEIPLWLPAAMAVLALVLWVMGNNRLDKTLKRVGLGVLAAAAAVGAVSYFLESDREQVKRHTYELVEAVEDRKWDQFKGLMHPEVRVIVLQGPDPVAEAAKNAVERSTLSSARITGITIENTQGTFTSRIQVLANNNVSNWDLEWRNLWGKWLLYEVKPLGGLGVTASDAERFIRGRAGF